MIYKPHTEWEDIEYINKKYSLSVTEILEKLDYDIDSHIYSDIIYFPLDINVISYETYISKAIKISNLVDTKHIFTEKLSMQDVLRLARLSIEQ